jgi:hypothetical protein
MALLFTQIKELVKSPKKTNQLSKAIRHENRIRFHVESFMDASEVSQPATTFLDWVKTLIPKDKYAIFLSLFTFPTPIVNLSDTIFKELERVFDGRNPSFDYEFTDSELKTDWEHFKVASGDAEAWRKKGWDAVKSKINSVLIVDLPKEQTTEFPEPYFYWLGIEHVIDYSYQDGTLQYIIFRQGDKKIAVFDDETMSVYDVNKNGELIDTDAQITPHGLGFCPARFFWTTELNQTMPEIKKSPISAQLADMDWALFFQTSKKHLDLYAPYPIYSAYEADCDFENGETGDYCDGGYLRGDDENYKVLRTGGVQQCPVCSEKRLAGVGSFIEIPVPANKDDVDLGKTPVTITTIDKSSLDYNVEEVARLRAKIFEGSVGVGGDMQAKQSINEMQVSANFESKISVLNSLKANLEAAMRYVDDTRCQLRYGDRYLGNHISLGTEFYIYSIDVLYKQYQQAKTNGAPSAELDLLSEQIIATEHRNNPGKIQRMSVLKQIEPYRHYTLDELLKLHDKELINKNLLKVKINFNTFVDRFERENTNILEFGMQLDQDKKIKLITDKFKEYANESTE